MLKIPQCRCCEAAEPSILGAVPVVASLTRAHTERFDPHRTQRTLWLLGKNSLSPGKLNPRSSKSIANGFFLKISIFSIYCHRVGCQHQLGVKDDRWPSPRASSLSNHLSPAAADFSLTFCCALLWFTFFVLSAQLRFCVNRFT